jgi:hypothetical protein
MNYYLVFVHNDVDPEIKGPYPSEEIRDDTAIDLSEEFGKNHGIYPLDIDGPGKPSIEVYSGGFLWDRR